MQQSKLWTKNFILIFIANFFVALNFYLLMTTLAVYAVAKFHVSDSVAGLAASMFVIGALVARLFAGKYIEVIGRKKMLFGSLLLFLVSTIFYFFSMNILFLLLIRFVNGVAFGIAANTMTTAIMDMIPKERMGEGAGYFALSPVFATAIGPFLGVVLVQYFDFNMVFITCTIFATITFITGLFAKIPEANLSKEQLEGIKSGFRVQDFFEMKALPISIVMFFIGVGYSGIVSFLNPYAIDTQLEKGASSFFIVYAVFLLFFRPLTGKLLDIKGDNFVIYPAILSFAFSLFLFSFAHHDLVVSSAGLFAALGYGTLMSSAQVVAVKEAPPSRVGLATSTYFICVDGGMGVGPYLIGLLIPYAGYRGMYFTLALLVLLTIVLYYFLHGKKAALRKKSLDITKFKGLSNNSKTSTF